MYIAAVFTAFVACSTVAALPTATSSMPSSEHDDFALQLPNSRKRVLESPIVEKFDFLHGSNGHGPYEKRGWLDILAVPDLAMRIKSFAESGPDN